VSSRHSRRRWPSDVGLHTPARREEEKGTCELKNQGPTRRSCHRPCALPPHGPCSSRCRPLGPAHHAAAPRALLVTSPPHVSYSSCHHPTGPSHRVATPQTLLVVPPPHGLFSSCRRSTCPGPPPPATSRLLEEKGKVSIEKRKLEKRKDRRRESEYGRR
jgi:hypothetical protein